MHYGLAGWLAIGLVAGGLARFILRGRHPRGLAGVLLVGLAGALAGGFIAAFIPGLDLVGGDPGGGFPWRQHLANIVVATGGAVLLLWLYRIWRGRPL